MALELIDEIAAVKNDIIVVIISDWLMPGMKGDELLIKAKKRAKNAKTILLTGHVDHVLLREIEENAQGIFRTLYKPWNEEQLIEMIKN